MKNVLVAVILSCTLYALPAAAGTNYDSKLIGFSPDGKYAAFESSALVDGLGEFRCHIEIRDLDSNKEISIEAVPSPTCDEAREEARSALKTYGIDGAIRGKLLTLRPEPARAASAGGASQTTSMGFAFKNSSCRLIPHEKRDEREHPMGITMIKWNVGLTCGNEPERPVLPEDWTVLSASIREARIVGDRLVVFATSTYPDFEGPGSSTGVIGALLGSPAAAVKFDMEVLGFSDDDKYFGYWLSGVDMREKTSWAELRLAATDNGRDVLTETETGPADSDPRDVLARLKKRVSAALAKYKIGNDPGTEMYKSGTATKTAFKIAGIGEHQVRLKTNKVTDFEEPTDILIRRPNKKEELVFGALCPGYRFSLNTVRLSKSNKTLAVMLKYSLPVDDVIERRAYFAAFTLIGK